MVEYGLLLAHLVGGVTVSVSNLLGGFIAALTPFAIPLFLLLIIVFIVGALKG